VLTELYDSPLLSARASLTIWGRILLAFFIFNGLGAIARPFTAIFFPV
jgi:hypothetical protein